jgi:ABC-2 type transport system permease protein
MTLSHLIAHEWKTRLSRPAALRFLALFAAVLIYGAVNGRIHRDARLAAIATHRADVSTTMASWLRDLRALEGSAPATGVPPWAGSAMDVTFATYLAPAPLGDFAIGQSDLLPHVGAVSLWNPDVRLFSRYELEDPVSLSLGAFDLGKAILLVLPLLLIVLSFDVVSSERDTSRLGLILAQGGSVRTLLWARLLIRSSAALGLTFLISCAALAVPGGAMSLAQRLPSFALWALCIVLYAVFWLAIIGFVASGNRRGEVNVMLLLFAWAGFNLILPASVAAIADAVYSPPSRLTYLAQAREVEVRTERTEEDVAHGFIIDHPDLVIDGTSQIPAYVRTAFFVTSAVDDATRPVLAAFDQAAAQRDETLGVLRYASPAIIMHGLFNDIAGTSSARHRRYVATARALKAAYADRAGRYIVAGRRLPLDEVASLPRFHLEDEPPGAILQRHTTALLVLALATGVLLWFADRRMKKKRRCSDGRSPPRW